jgi:Tol biopolymer transport system component
MRIRTGTGHLLVAVFVLALARLPARADTPVEPSPDLPRPSLPRATWYTLQTPHFDIHFYPAERAFAEQAAHVAERAYRLITRYFNWRPSGPVNVTLNDYADEANGFANSIPYTFFFAFGAPPDSLDELNDFDDYVKLLATHEFTHVVHLDTMLSRCPVLYNMVFGRQWAPNLMEPVWLVEGMAVLMETRQTTGGRLRSSFFDMHLRVPLLEHRMFGLDQISAIPLAYPGGTAAYLYGSNILRYIEDRYGPAKIREISHRYADTCVPGGLNRTVTAAVGRGYVGLFGPGIFDDWKRSLAHHVALEVEDARRRPLTQATRLTFDAPSPRSEGPGAKFFRDGTLVYHRANDDQSPAYVRLDPESGARRLIADMQGGGPASPTPDGTALIFQRTNFLPIPFQISSNADLAWDDLYRLDLASGTIRPLTRGLRAHEPDVSPDGKWVACVLVGTGSRQLALVPIVGGGARVLMRGAPGFAYTPAWSPDGRLIAYSRWKLGGYRDIHIYDLATATDRAISVDRALDSDPRFSPDGRFVLFASDRTGISNIFAYELATRRLMQVTNLLSGAFQPAVSPDGRRLVFTGFTSEGFDVWTTAYDPAAFWLAEPYANARPDSPQIVDEEADSPDAEPQDTASVPFAERITPYRPWKYMYPRQWTIEAPGNTQGLGQTLELATTVGDPVYIHSLSGLLLLPTGGPWSGQLSYSYARLWPTFYASVSRSEVNQTQGLVIGGQNTSYLQETVSASASTSLPILRTPDASGDISLAYDYSAYGPVRGFPPADPTAGISVRPEVGPYADVKLSWSFSNAHGWPYSVSAQEGRQFSFTLRLADPALGGRFRTTELSLIWSEYWTPPWARLHAFALLAAGGAGMGDKRDFFAVGGYGRQDVLRSVLLNQSQYAALRGYPAGFVSGDQYALLTAEYRAPLLWVEHFYDTVPFYLRRIWGVAFAETGNAFTGVFRAQDLKTDLGLEAHFQVNVAYYRDATVELGYARGIDAGGGNHVYFVASYSYF